MLAMVADKHLSECSSSFCYVFRLSLSKQFLLLWYMSLLQDSLLYKKTQHKAWSSEVKTWYTEVFFHSTCCSALEQSATKSCRCYCSHIVQETSRQLGIKALPIKLINVKVKVKVKSSCSGCQLDDTWLSGRLPIYLNVSASVCVCMSVWPGKC